MSVRQTIEIHGQPVTYHMMGEGPPVLLVHGITSSSRTWKSVMPRLSENHTVIAPDLLGHGRSSKPQGDYSLGAYASGMRDLLVALDVPKATVVGHSLGGGIAMQFGYQFPDRVARLVLVDTGGIGREVNPALRAAALPGAELVLPLLFSPTLHDAGLKVRNFLAGIGLHGSADVEGVAEGFASLTEADARRAFVNTVRSVIDPSGQRVSAADRLYLTRDIPSLIIWGDRTAVGIGGGVCQVSTTAFRAAFLGGFPIEERWNHGYVVGRYGQPGLDATIYTPTVDFKFRNTTDHHIIIKSVMDEVKGTLTFNFYGTKPDWNVEVTGPEILKESPPPAPIYQTDASLAEGEVRQVEYAKNGMDVAWRRVIRDSAGQVLTDEVLESSYTPWAAYFLVGPGAAPAANG